MLRHHHFSQQALLAERVAFVVRKMTRWNTAYACAARRDKCLKFKTEITSMRHRFGFTQRIINAENTLLK